MKTAMIFKILRIFQIKMIKNFISIFKILNIRQIIIFRQLQMDIIILIKILTKMK